MVIGVTDLDILFRDHSAFRSGQVGDTHREAGQVPLFRPDDDLERLEIVPGRFNQNRRRRLITDDLRRFEDAPVPDRPRKGDSFRFRRPFDLRCEILNLVSDQILLLRRELFPGFRRKLGAVAPERNVLSAEKTGKQKRRGEKKKERPLEEMIHFVRLLVFPSLLRVVGSMTRYRSGKGKPPVTPSFYTFRTRFSNSGKIGGTVPANSAIPPENEKGEEAPFSLLPLNAGFVRTPSGRYSHSIVAGGFGVTS